MSRETEIDRGYRLQCNEVHVWKISLKSCAIDTSHDILAWDERQAAGRLRCAEDRCRLFARRIARRQILSLYAGQRPQELTFTKNEWGKPRLSGKSATRGIEFNASSSRDLGVITVSQLPLGVDVEYKDSQIDFPSVAASVFSAATLRNLRSVAESEQCSAFYRYWTQLEALGKALGRGLSLELPQELPVWSKTINPTPIAVALDSNPHQTWWLHCLDLHDDDYQATLCCNTEKCRLRYFDMRHRFLTAEAPETQLSIAAEWNWQLKAAQAP